MAATLINRIWALIAERGRTLAQLPDHPDPQVRAAQLASELLSERGEATTAARASALLTLYRALNSSQRHEFHLFLARHFLPDGEALQTAAAAYLANPSSETASVLAAAAAPPRLELIRRMNIATGAIGTLVKMRSEVLDALSGAPELQPLEHDLHHLLSAWFNPGFLELRRIDWHTSAVILEKLIAYEAVHEIQGWDDLRRRLAPDRRCYAFFHPALDDEPLIFVEVALCNGLASKIEPLLGRETSVTAEAADTAIFYSISNCQPGLRKISFGNFLIKHVVEELRAELPQLKHFATLSPIPGFRRWLEKRLDSGEEGLLLESERASFASPALPEFARALMSEAALPELKPILLRLCARYLTASAEGRGTNDPVARFHLRNGARVERIHWRANENARGLAESYGLMVNYCYDTAAIEANHEAFVRDGKVAVSLDVAKLLKPAPKRFAKPVLRAAE